MTDLLDQASKRDGEKMSLTLWLTPDVIEGINELVLRGSNRKSITSKSDVVSQLVKQALRRTK